MAYVYQPEPSISMAPAMANYGYNTVGTYVFEVDIASNTSPAFNTGADFLVGVASANYNFSDTVTRIGEEVIIDPAHGNMRAYTFGVNVLLAQPGQLMISVVYNTLEVRDGAITLQSQTPMDAPGFWTLPIGAPLGLLQCVCEFTSPAFYGGVSSGNIQLVHSGVGVLGSIPFGPDGYNYVFEEFRPVLVMSPGLTATGHFSAAHIIESYTYVGLPWDPT